MSNFEQLERRIQEIEDTVSIEVRVVITHRKLTSALGGFRVALIAVGLAGLTSDFFWLLVPNWIFLAVVIAIAFLPEHLLTRMPLARSFLSAKERRQHLANHAMQIFRTLKMDATTKGNALLVLFCTAERAFFILPDSRMEKDWSAHEWDSYTAKIAKRMSASGKDRDSGIVNSGLELLDAVQEHALQKYGPRVPLKPESAPAKSAADRQTDELSNAVVIIR
jgi:uncharacterized membrane protein